MPWRTQADFEAKDRELRTAINESVNKNTGDGGGILRGLGLKRTERMHDHPKEAIREGACWYCKALKADLACVMCGLPSPRKKSRL